MQRERESKHRHAAPQISNKPVKMMKVVSLALVLCACSITDAARYITLGSQHETAWSKPFFCHDLECPKFRNLTHEGDLFETREYAPGARQHQQTNSKPLQAQHLDFLHYRPE